MSYGVQFKFLKSIVILFDKLGLNGGFIWWENVIASAKHKNAKSILQHNI